MTFEIPETRRRLADYLSEYAYGVVEEGMRIVEIEEDVKELNSSAFQARVTWMGDGTFLLGEHGQYRLIVTVEALPDLPLPRAHFKTQVEWTTATWANVLKWDSVRLPGRPETEAVVESVITLPWHAKSREYVGQDGKTRDHVTPHPHEKVHVRLAGRTDLLAFSPDQPVEIMMDAERRATAQLQLTFGAERVD